MLPLRNGEKALYNNEKLCFICGERLCFDKK